MEKINLDSWPQDFEKKNGRKLKVLHVGNIANNAYLNSKILRDTGVECDVLSYDYYHIMGCPEWEECKTDMRTLDQFDPHWYQIDMNNYQRPKWFVQGQMITALKYLIHRGQNNFFRAFIYWFFLSYQNKTTHLFPVLRFVDSLIRINLFFIKVLNRYIIYLIRKSKMMPLLRRTSFFRFINQRIFNQNIVKSDQAQNSDSILQQKQSIMLKTYSNVDISNKQQLSSEELSPYYAYSQYWEKVFSFYDIIQFYATSGVYGLISDRQYLAFEHGTIRKIPFQDDHLGRVTSAVYKSAQGVFITNCDNIVAAQKLGLKNYYFVPHPVNEESSDATHKFQDINYLRKKFDADFLILHPSRQDWSEQRDANQEKGNDIFIKGIAQFLKLRHIKLKCILVEWGVSIEQTKKLISSLNVEENFVWIKPLTHSLLVEYMRLSDAVFDQTTIGTFGAVPPKCLSMGKPVFVHLENSFHHWCFPNLPPVFKCKTAEHVAQELGFLTSTEFNKEDFKKKSEKWYFDNYSKHRVRDVHLLAYQKLLSAENALGAKL